MLWTSGNALRLNTLDIRRRHFAGKVGILGEIFKVSAAKGASLYVKAGAEKNVNIVCSGFFTKCRAKFLAESQVPCICHGCGCGEAGCRDRCVESKVVCSACLFSKAVGAVGKENLGYICVFDRHRCPSGEALKQSRLFFKR